MDPWHEVTDLERYVFSITSEYERMLEPSVSVHVYWVLARYRHLAYEDYPVTPRIGRK